MKSILLSTFVMLCSMGLWAQKGEVWPSSTRQEFELNSKGEITKEGAETIYKTYYLFINNNEFIHCTDGITSLYKILSRKEVQGGTEYKTISEAGNTYQMLFNKKEKYIVISAIDRNYSIFIGCLEPYQTKVFDNINR